MHELRVVVVEDEKDLRTMLVYGLKAQGVGLVQGVGSAGELYNILDSVGADIVVLDLGLPDEDGISVALRLQNRANIGIIIVSARNLPEDRLLGLQCGADSYFTKPVNIAELSQSIINLARRITQPTQVCGNNQWKYSVEKQRLITPAGVEVCLTSSECVLLSLLMRSIGKPVKRYDILTSLGKPDDPKYLKSLHMLVSRLKTKVQEHDAQNPLPIYTRPGPCYEFVIGLTDSL